LSLKRKYFFFDNRVKMVGLVKTRQELGRTKLAKVAKTWLNKTGKNLVEQNWQKLGRTKQILGRTKLRKAAKKWSNKKGRN
jgi:hypothetical protein